MLHVIEIFNSIQGEAGHAGIPCAFVRLARCNLRCGYCDTPYSFGAGEAVSLDKVLETVSSYGVKHVCITGGEPMLHGDRAVSLMQAFLDRGYTVMLETNGVIPLDEVPGPVVKVVDVKTPEALNLEAQSDEFLRRHLHYPNLALLNAHDELKFVLCSRKDYDWAKGFLEQHQLYGKCRHVLFSPSWDDLSPQDLVQWILADQLPVRLNLQLHKYIWGAEVQGV
jgi:7-carboxy-7-deazaguanine synthase